MTSTPAAILPETDVPSPAEGAALRVVHVNAELKNQASGPAHSIPNLVYGLRRAGVDASLEALAPVPDELLDFPQRYHPKWRLLRPLGISPSMRRALHREARGADIIHTHNLWMMPNIYPLAAARRNGCKLVLSPRGTLKQWAFQYRRGRKLLVWHLMQRRVVFGADLLHATAEEEVRDLRGLGLRAPVALIPNGVHVPELPEAPAAASAAAEPRTILYLGRIHPQKGIEKLLHAWSRLHTDFPGWRLEIVGQNRLGHLEELQALAATLDLPRCTFGDEVYGAAKESVYRKASLYVLPSYTENFGITVAEALACGVPAIVFEGAPWQGLGERRCGWWIPGDLDALTATLREALGSDPGLLRQMGRRGHYWMREAFSWDFVAREMAAAYRWLAGRGERPDCIHEA